MRAATQANSINKLIPQNIKPYLLKGLVLVVVWNLLYKLILLPAGIPDNQLRDIVQYGTAETLSLFYESITQRGTVIYINHIPSVSIGYQCNGLELMVLYIGFMLCVPTNLRRLILFSIIGSFVIYFLNVVRCSLLAVMYINHNDLTDFAHHYAFKMAIYAVVFYGWVLYAKKTAPDEK